MHLVSPQPDASLGGKLTIDSNVEDGDFSGRRLSYLSVVGARLTHCRFERMRIEQAYLGSGGAASTYVGCSFDGSSFDILFAGFARFERCTFRDVNITEWRGETAELVNCVFTGRIKRAIFWGTPAVRPGEAYSVRRAAAGEVRSSTADR